MRLLPILALTLSLSSLGACAPVESRSELLERRDDIDAISSGAALGGPTSDPVLCAGVTVDPTGARDASEALRLCIARAAPGSVLELRPGTYRLDTTLAIDRDDLTLATLGLRGNGATCLRGASACARFVPGPAFAGSALVEVGRARAANRVTLDHLVLDGDGPGGGRTPRKRTRSVTPAAGGTCSSTEAMR